MPDPVAAILLAAALATAAAIYLRRRRKPRPRTVECAACGKTLPVTRAVIVHGRIDHHRDGAATTVAEYHKRCQPEDR